MLQAFGGFAERALGSHSLGDVLVYDHGPYDLAFRVADGCCGVLDCLALAVISLDIDQFVQTCFSLGQRP